MPPKKCLKNKGKRVTSYRSMLPDGNETWGAGAKPLRNHEVVLALFCNAEKDFDFGGAADNYILTTERHPESTVSQET